jgi:hypothetical protein
VITYRATLDVPRELVWFVARLLLAERRRRGTPEGSRALTCFWQAVLRLRWFRDRTMQMRWGATYSLTRSSVRSSISTVTRTSRRVSFARRAAAGLRRRRRGPWAAGGPGGAGRR